MKIKITCDGEIIAIDRKGIYSEITWGEGKERIEESKIVISIKYNRISYIKTPPYYVGDLFYAKIDNGYVISDSLYVVAGDIKHLTVDKNIERYFILKGYCPAGITLFKEIKRIYNNAEYYFIDGMLKHKSLTNTIVENDTVNANEYDEFKHILNRIVDRNITSNPAVMLSGGADSRLIALLLAERNKNTKVISGLGKPVFDSNGQDVYLANELARRIGLSVINAEFDYADASVNSWHPLIELMPCCSHPAFIFLSMFKSCKNEKIDTVWSGQNMDALYNMGPTERFEWNRRGIGAAFKRFFLSEEYFKSLPDIEGNSSVFTNIFAKIGLKAFQKAYGRSDLSLPHGKDDVLNNFTQSRFYTVFGHDDILSIDKKELPETCSAYDLKRELFKVKLSYLKGGDSSVISSSGKLHDIHVELPYSDPEMVEFFEAMHLTAKDIFKPKRFVYRYIAEFADRYGNEINNFKIPACKLREAYGNFADIYKVFGNILNNSKIGGELRQYSGAEGKGSLDAFLVKVHRYWLDYEYKILRKNCMVTIN